MQKIIVILFCVFLIPIFSIAHSGKAKYHVIIDTDCAADDLRAITFILASPEFEVIAITTSDGILKPKEGYKKIKSLLSELGHEGIPVAYGKSLGDNLNDCHDKNIAIKWGQNENYETPKESSANKLIIQSVNNEDEKVVLICLGPLTNIQEVLKQEEIRNQIDRIYWYCNDFVNSDGFNYELDKQSAELFKDADINKYILSSMLNEDLKVDNDFCFQITQEENKYIDIIKQSHSQELISNSYFKLWDDLIPLFMLFPENFNITEVDNKTFIVHANQDYRKQIIEAIIRILDSKYSKEGKVFNGFPIDPSLYQDDIKSDINKIINNHGLSEFRAAVLTNELHGHLGIYSIIGVKMGIRVREYFNVGVDDIHIVSYAGSRPPISCLNDGLQVSTGATLGHGLISISDNEKKLPAAEFEFKGKKIKLTLKNEYWQMIRGDVKAGIEKYGNLTEAYWEHIRKLAIRYWAELDRMEIFEMTVN